MATNELVKELQSLANSAWMDAEDRITLGEACDKLRDADKLAQAVTTALEPVMDWDRATRSLTQFSVGCQTAVRDALGAARAW